MLASDVVTAVVSDHNLTITGDGNPDAYSIIGDNIAGDVQIYVGPSIDGQQTQINGIQDGTPVSPAGLITLTGVTGNITINLGAGDAAVDISNLTVNQNLSITGGNGNDNVAITNVNVGKNLSITTGNGNDTMSLGVPDALLAENLVTVGGNLTIAAGNGHDLIQISASAGLDAAVIGPRRAAPVVDRRRQYIHHGR